MKAVFSPSFPFGEVFAPPSKSMAHRYLICGALSEQSRVSGLAMSEDIKATADCLKALGSRVDFENDTALVGGLCPKEEAQLDCRESGSTLRFMLPLALLGGKEITLTGSPRLMERGAGLYEQMCSEHGLFFENKDGKITVKGPLKPGKYSIDGSLSSQYGDSELKVKGKLQSRPYVNMTIKALADFGVKIERIPGGFFIPGGQKFLSRYAAVEGDWSNAAFLSALSDKVIVKGLDEHSLQGDKLYPQLFKNVGSYQIDLSDTPDLAPVLFAVAALKDKGDFVGTRRLKIKESDRAEAMKNELLKFGVNTTIFDDRVIVSGKLKTPSAELYGHNDHRIVMALSVLAARVGGVIDGAEAVSKSFPDFFDVIKKLNVKVNLTDA